MINRLFVVIVVIISFETLEGINIYSQMYDFNWVTGLKIKREIDSLEGVSLMNFKTSHGNMVINYSTKILGNGIYYGSNMSDQAGKYLMSFGGYRLYDNTGNEIRNSNKICPKDICSYEPQSTLFLPGLDSSSYMLITGEQMVAGDTTAIVVNLRFNYSKILNIVDSGLVIQTTRIPFIIDSVDLGRLTACRHANGRDWWIIIGKYMSSKVHTILTDGERVLESYIQDIGKFSDNTFGQSCYSHDGNYYCITSKEKDQIKGLGRLEVFNFDRCTGALTNRQLGVLDTTEYYSPGCCFSPNSKYLYISTASSLFQYDLSEGLLDKRELIGEYDGYVCHVYDNLFYETHFGPLLLAPDGKIYMNTDVGQTRNIHVINDPNLPGKACNFEQHNISLRSIISTLPHFPNYRLGSVNGSICDSLGINNLPWCWWRYEQDTIDYLCFSFTDLSAYNVKDWQWTFNDGSNTSNLSSPNYCFSKKGTYNVCLIVKNENGSDTLCRILNIGVNSVQNYSNYNFDFFPNPIQNYLVFNVFDYVPQNMYIKLYNAMGTEVVTKRIYQGSNFVEDIAGSNGFYLLVVMDNNRIIKTYKVFKSG